VPWGKNFARRDGIKIVFAASNVGFSAGSSYSQIAGAVKWLLKFNPSAQINSASAQTGFASPDEFGDS